MITIGKNQFVMADSNEILDCSERISFADKTIYMGQGCHYLYKKRGQFEIVIIGFALNCRNSNYEEDEFLQELFGAIECGNIFGQNYLDYWGGRYVVISYDQNEYLAFGDCCGLKQFFSGKSDSGDFCLASQARYIAALLKKDLDQSALEYLNLAINTDKEYAWPLNGTKYKDVERILPNHYFSSRNLSQHRMVFTLPAYNETEAEALVSEYLRNEMVSITSRYSTAITFTAGLDSRIVFSHSLDCKNVDYVTLKYIGMKADSEDIEVPKKICNQLRKLHNIISCDGVTDEFVDRYKKHSEDGHDYWVQMAFGITKNNYSDHIWVKGSCNEVMQFSGGILPHDKIDSRLICKLFNIPETEYSKHIISDWLMNAKKFSELNGIDLLNLFYWEHRMGSWLAVCLNEQDCVGETFTPFNTRVILLLINSINFKDRVAPGYAFYKRLIERISKDLLVIPINRGRYKTLLSKLRCYIKYRCPYIYYRYVYFL